MLIFNAARFESGQHFLLKVNFGAPPSSSRRNQRMIQRISTVKMMPMHINVSNGIGLA
jgi:hypothetical protein